MHFSTIPQNIQKQHTGREREGTHFHQFSHQLRARVNCKVYQIRRLSGNTVLGKQISFPFWGFFQPTIMETWSNRRLRDRTFRSTENMSHSAYFSQLRQLCLGMLNCHIFLRLSLTNFGAYSSKKRKHISQFLKKESESAALSNPSLSYFQAPTWATMRVWKYQFNQRNEFRAPLQPALPPQQPPAASVFPG